MAMPHRKNGRRKITVDGIVYWWNPMNWEATEQVRILGESGRGSTIRVNPLQIMTPKHVAACIRHAISIGWSTDSKVDLWLGFDENDVDAPIFQVPPNSTVFRNEENRSLGITQGPEYVNDKIRLVARNATQPNKSRQRESGWVVWHEIALPGPKATVLANSKR